ncbi:MAG: succinate dehydrogenase assembly factor 2 [Woeseiaceae bacterium]|nr:succinate dehydrogenase assembly factor 2 [Woeseiaceae bacterium]
MRELDRLLETYLDRCYAAAPDGEKAAFEAVLALSDPELVDYLLKRQRPAESSIAGVIERILEQDIATG